MDKVKITSSEFLKTREEFVTDWLREAILTGEIKPGEKLDQKEISELLQVSRSPVREAIRVLASEGLLELIPHRGSVVANLSDEEFEEIYFIRKILEGTATSLAAEMMTADRLARLDSLAEELDQTEDLDNWLELNREFHNTIYQVINRPRLVSIIENLRNSAAPFIRHFVDTVEGRKIAQESHRRIIAACQQRNGLLAQIETERHLEEVCQGFLARKK